MDGGIQKGVIGETSLMGDDPGQSELGRLQERRGDATLKNVKPENHLVKTRDVTKSDRTELTCQRRARDASVSPPSGSHNDTPHGNGTGPG